MTQLGVKGEEGTTAGAVGRFGSWDRCCRIGCFSVGAVGGWARIKHGLCLLDDFVAQGREPLVEVLGDGLTAHARVRAISEMVALGWRSR